MYNQSAQETSQDQHNNSDETYTDSFSDTQHKDKSFHLFDRYVSNMAALKLYRITDMFNETAGQMDHPEHWFHFSSITFIPNAKIKYSKVGGPDDGSVYFEPSLLPMIGKTLATNNVIRIQITVKNIESRLLRDFYVYTEMIVSIESTYSDSSSITVIANMRLFMNKYFKIEWADIKPQAFIPNVGWQAIEEVLYKNPSMINTFRSLSRDDNSNANFNSIGANMMNDYSSQNNAEKFEAITKFRSNFEVFRNVSIYGTHDDIMRVMQIGNVVSAMKNIQEYQRLHNIVSPIEAFMKTAKEFKERQKEEDKCTFKEMSGLKTPDKKRARNTNEDHDTIYVDSSTPSPESAPQTSSEYFKQEPGTKRRKTK
ncbi:LIM-domain binding protein [Nakaseomyces glabratus]